MKNLIFCIDKVRVLGHKGLAKRETPLKRFFDNIFLILKSECSDQKAKKSLLSNTFLVHSRRGNVAGKREELKEGA